MKTFKEIYKSSKVNSNNKNQIKKLNEVTYSDLPIRDELIHDLKKDMVYVLLEYSDMDLTYEQIIECIDEACRIVKENIKIEN